MVTGGLQGRHVRRVHGGDAALPQEPPRLLLCVMMAQRGQDDRREWLRTCTVRDGYPGCGGWSARRWQRLLWAGIAQWRARDRPRRQRKLGGRGADRGRVQTVITPVIAYRVSYYRKSYVFRDEKLYNSQPRVSRSENIDQAKSHY
jgi:hypothetical protein